MTRRSLLLGFLASLFPGRAPCRVYVFGQLVQPPQAHAIFMPQETPADIMRVLIRL